MRHSWFVLIFSIMMLSAAGQPPGYCAFPDNSRWRVDYSYDNPYQFPCYIKHYFDYSMQGDTTINQLVYKKIYRSWVATDTLSCDDPNVSSEAPVAGYAGALRDDPSANAVFFRFPDASADSLLFDYNLEPGDTLKSFISRYLSHYTMVTVTVDSVLTDDGIQRRRWNFDGIHNHPSYIIEGVGSSFGLIEQAYSYALDFTERFLVCLTSEASMNSHTIFSSAYTSEMGCSPVVQGVCEHRGANFRIYPNPMTTTVTLISDRYLDHARIMVLDCLGRTFLVKENVCGYSCSLRRGNLPEGLYFVVLEPVSGEFFCKKLYLRSE